MPFKFDNKTPGLHRVRVLSVFDAPAECAFGTRGGRAETVGSRIRGDWVSVMNFTVQILAQSATDTYLYLYLINLRLTHGFSLQTVFI